MSKAWNKVFTVQQGATFTRRITFKNKDLTGWSARMFLKRDLRFGESAFELTSANSGAVVSTDGNSPVVDSYVDLTISAINTDLLSGNYYSDLELVLSDVVYRPFSCKFVVDDGATR